MREVWLVTIFGAYIWVKEENNFKTLEDANAFLLSKDFEYDTIEEGIHYWIFEENTFASIEKC